jgi:hypothetical protein
MSGLGAMMAGGNPASGPTPRNWYRTPEEATMALVLAESFDGIIHECCCGDGAIAKVLETHGYKVVANDIHPLGYGVKRDFFTIERAVGHNIVTNPPFDLAEKMIRHGLTLNPRKMAFLLKATYFHAANRIPLFNEHPPATIYPLTWRLDFKNLGKPTMECAWFVWERGVKREPIYKLLRRPTAESNPH